MECRVCLVIQINELTFLDPMLERSPTPSKHNSPSGPLLRSASLCGFLTAGALFLPFVGTRSEALAQIAPGSSGAPKEVRIQEFIDRARIQIRATVTANDKTVTEDERVLIRSYWDRALRLQRIREVAELEHDTASFERATSLTHKFTKRFYADLRRQNLVAAKKASGPTKAPTIASEHVGKARPAGGH